MKDVVVTDDGGDTVTFIEHNGCFFPKFVEPHGIEGLNSLPIRDDDVIIVTFPKSGTNWMVEIAQDLVSGQTVGKEFSAGKCFMELAPKETVEQQPSPRVLCTHVYLDQLPAEVRKKKTKIILVIRNPKDVAVSLFNFLRKMPKYNYNGKWENYLGPYVQGKLIYGSWFDHMRSWDKARADNPDLPILTLYYEDLKENQVREMRKMCTFLNLERSDNFLQEVLEHTSIQNMKSRKPEIQQVMFRKGEIGDWKNWFTVAQNEWFDKIYQEETKDIHHPIRFT